MSSIDFLNRNKAAGYGKYGPVQRTMPKTARGSFWSFAHKCVKVFCAECQSLQWISDVTAVEQLSQEYVSQCVLGCGHTRNVTQQVRK